jgi:hypothetical protein
MVQVADDITMKTNSFLVVTTKRIWYLIFFVWFRVFCAWFRVFCAWFRVFCVVLCCVVSCGFVLFRVVSCGFVLFRVVSCGFVCCVLSSLTQLNLGTCLQTHQQSVQNGLKHFRRKIPNQVIYYFIYFLFTKG